MVGCIMNPSSFFNKIPEDKWNSKYKEEAKKYDENEIKHAHATDNELTPEALKKIAQAGTKAGDNTAPAADSQADKHVPINNS